MPEFNLNRDYNNFVVGYYIYAEASSPRQPDDRARLASPILTGSHCVVFRYHMNGADMGSLRVYGRVGSFEQQVWEGSGDQADTWKGVEFRIDTTAQYQVGKPDKLPHSWSVITRVTAALNKG